MFLSKQVLTIVAGRLTDNRSYRSLYTSKVQTTPPGAKRPPHMASAFLVKYVSITISLRCLKYGYATQAVFRFRLSL